MEEGVLTMTLEELTSLAERCLEIVKDKSEMLEGCMMDALTAGEPESAINDALDIAYEHPELYSEFPDEVYELAKDPDYTMIHPYLDLLERYRNGKTA